MSDKNIPFEIQTEIIKRLPVKSLLRFCTVSKSYNSLINSSDFIKHYIGQQQQQHLLVRYEDIVARYEYEYVSIIDDEHTLPITIPPLVKNLKSYITVGTSHGLLCLFGDCQERTKAGRAVIWNPCIRKAINIFVPNVRFENIYRTALGFGVCPETIVPKIVKITHSSIETAAYVPWQVEVFTLSTQSWRSLCSSISNLPRKSVYVDWDQVDVDGCVYWLAHDRDTLALEDDTFRSYNLIVSFDLTTEEFRQVNLPDSLARVSCSLSVYKIGESLAVIEVGFEDNKLVYHVWMMEDDGVTKSFKKLFSFGSHTRDVSIVDVRGFRETGEALIEFCMHPGTSRVLAAYDPYSKSICNIEIYGRHCSYSVYPYMETLLLL